MLHARIALMVCLCLAALGLPPASAHADDVNRSASARALFEQGVNHTDKAEWAEAADAFRGALALRDSPVIRYNLASALRELGRLVEASELLHALLAGSSVDAALRDNAQALLAELKPRIGHLTLHAPADLTITALTLDAQPLDAAQLGLPLPVDPGTHHVQGESSRGRLELQEVRVAEGASVDFALRGPAAAEALATQLSVPPVRVKAAPDLTPTHTARLAVAQGQGAHARDERARSAKRDRRMTWGISSAAFGVAAAVVVTALLLPRGKSSKDASPGDFDPPSVGVNVPP
jgi:hypothetical protein